MGIELHDIGEPIFEAYAIRQKSTGYFLPMSWDGKGRHSYSYDQPTAGSFPRLFKSKRAAVAALAAWLTGEWQQDIYESDDSYFGAPYQLATPIPKHGTSREFMREDMEIVKFRLVEEVFLEKV